MDLATGVAPGTKIMRKLLLLDRWQTKEFLRKDVTEAGNDGNINKCSCKKTRNHGQTENIP